MPLCEQILVPRGVTILGYAIAHSFSVVLGWWFILCGISLYFMARWEHKRTWSQRRSTVDDTIRSKS